MVISGLMLRDIASVKWVCRIARYTRTLQTIQTPGVNQVIILVPVALMPRRSLPAKTKRTVSANILPVRGKALQFSAHPLGHRQHTARPTLTIQSAKRIRVTHSSFEGSPRRTPYAQPPILCIPRFIRAAALTEQLDGVETKCL